VRGQRPLEPLVLALAPLRRRCHDRSD
jgi:hypothetical protein